jgi:hypothetical protein
MISETFNHKLTSTTESSLNSTTPLIPYKLKSGTLDQLLLAACNRLIHLALKLRVLVEKLLVPSLLLRNLTGGLSLLTLKLVRLKQHWTTTRLPFQAQEELFLILRIKLVNSSDSLLRQRRRTKLRRQTLPTF